MRKQGDLASFLCRQFINLHVFDKTLDQTAIFAIFSDKGESWLNYGFRIILHVTPKFLYMYPYPELHFGSAYIVFIGISSDILFTLSSQQNTMALQMLLWYLSTLEM